MPPDPERHGLRQHPLVRRGGRVVVVQAPVGGVVAVHGVPGRPHGGLVGPQIDLPVAHRIERPGLREGLSRGILQRKTSVIVLP